MVQLNLESFDDLRFYTKDHFYREALSRMIARFLKTVHFDVEPGREHKPVRTDVIGDHATTTVERLINSVVGSAIAHRVSRHLGVPYSTH